MWKKLVIHDTQSLIQLRAGYKSRKVPENKSIQFFTEVLSQAKDIPLWEFSCAGYSKADGQMNQSLMRVAMNERHCFSIEIRYQEFYNIDLNTLQYCQNVRVLLDEAYVPHLELSEFYNALAWAKQKSIRVIVQVNLNQAMLQKVIENLVLPRLLDLVDKIIFHVPKDAQRPQLTRDQFGFFLDYIALKMLRMRVLKKIDIDACMIPALSIIPRKKFTQCAYQDTLTLLLDGGIKICPHGPVIEMVETPEQFQQVKRMLCKKRYRQMLSHCIWREDWNLQESERRYSLK